MRRKSSKKWFVPKYDSDSVQHENICLVAAVAALAKTSVKSVARIFPDHYQQVTHKEIIALLRRKGLKVKSMSYGKLPNRESRALVIVKFIHINGKESRLAHVVAIQGRMVFDCNEKSWRPFKLWARDTLPVVTFETFPTNRRPRSYAIGKCFEVE